VFRSGNPQSFIPGAAILINRLVKFDAATGRVIQGAARADDCIGVSLEAAAAADGAAIAVALIDGATVVELAAGEAIVVGETICSDATGRALDADTAADAQLGVALSAAAAAGEFISVLLKLQSRVV